MNTQAVNKRNLQKRSKGIYTLLHFATVLGRNGAGFGTDVFVPGRNGRQYNVYPKRVNGKFVCECRMNLGGKGDQTCKGNGYSVCYHVLVAVAKLAHDKGKRVWFYSSLKDAQKQKKGGRIIEVMSKHSRKSVWMIVK